MTFNDWFNEEYPDGLNYYNFESGYSFCNIPDIEKIEDAMRKAWSAALYSIQKDIEQEIKSRYTRSLM